MTIEWLKAAVQESRVNARATRDICLLALTQVAWLVGLFVLAWLVTLAALASTVLLVVDVLMRICLATRRVLHQQARKIVEREDREMNNSEPWGPPIDLTNNPSRKQRFQQAAEEELARSVYNTDDRSR